MVDNKNDGSANESLNDPAVKDAEKNQGAAAGFTAVKKTSIDITIRKEKTKSDRGAQNNETEDAARKEAETAESQAGESVTKGANAEAGESQAGESVTEGANAEAAESQAGESVTEGAEAEGEESQAGESVTGGANAEGGESKAGESETQGAEAEGEESQTAESETEEAEAEGGESKAGESVTEEANAEGGESKAGESETEEAEAEGEESQAGESAAEAEAEKKADAGAVENRKEPVRTKAEKKRAKRRSAEILGVFAKHNFYVNGLTPEELRSTLEDMGPTYVKIGQIMSSRVDLLPESYCKELEKLRQNVQELEPVLAKEVIEQETGKKIEEIYSEFRDKPLGSASIGQAHYAVLKDGTPVVTKVQRPFIADMMRQDFVLLKKLASIFNVVMEGAEDAEDQLDLLDVIEEFEKVTDEELDCRVEAANTKLFREKCIDDPEKVTCPEVYDELTTERIFTMSFVDGYSISRKDRLISEGYDVLEIGRNIVDNYLHQLLDVGLFHADPHQGNIMVSHGVPCWIDFGMLGHITDADINTIQTMILSVLERDVENLANAIISIGAASAKTNRDKLIEDIDVFLDRYMTVTSLNDLDVSVLFEEVCALGEKHHVKMPGKFTMLARSLGTIEGVIEQLCPELNLFEIISDKLMNRAKKNFDLEQQLISAGKDALEIGKKAAKIPVLASDLLKSAARGRMKMNLELTGYEELLNKGGNTVKSIMLALFSCVLFIGSCVMCIADISPKAPGGVPALAAIGLIFSIALGIYAVRQISK